MLSRSNWAHTAIERLKKLHAWREHIVPLAKAAWKILPEAKVYIYGGAAENRLTVLSDIDVLIVHSSIPLNPKDKMRLKIKLWQIAEEYGVPWDYPFDIHLLTPEEFENFKRNIKLLVEVRDIENNITFYTYPVHLMK